MTLSELIAPLALALRCPGLAADAQGACAFTCEGVTVCLVPCDDGPAFLARAHLGELTVQTVRHTIEPLLAANLFADGVGGSSLCLDGQGQVFLLQRFREAGLEPDELIAWLERFVRHGAACAALLGSAPATAQTQMPAAFFQGAA